MMGFHNCLLMLLIGLGCLTFVSYGQANPSSSPKEPQCTDQIKATTQKELYLAYTTSEAESCTWTVEVAQGEKISLELQPPKDQSKPCGFKVFDGANETQLDCTNNNKYTSNGNQIIVRIEKTHQNTTYYVQQA
ncbi:hypothetical protein FGIG_01179 [Fasciola gigantica]|uniref:CUB domain-containing protein n=1 Tax=Fasciola gigantica TaxID=46835 RepID=A0A504YQB6_FASGI|nr:hypothetical protein FGIG_01179 [Fasciola gigantica]